MALSNELISQFAKLTAKPEKTKTESTVYGTAKIENDTVFVKIDGSDRLTPVQTAVDVEDGERVIVSVKDHSATITGNTSPSGVAARVETVKDQGKKLDEFDIIVSYKVTTDDLSAVNATIENLKAVSAKYEDMTAVTAEIETLQAKFANLTYVNAEDVTAINAEIESLQAMFGEFTGITADDMDVVNAEIDNLQAHTANFTYVSTELLKAYKARIEELDTKKLDAEQADLKYANIDFANIGEAAIRKIFSDSGMIKDLVVSDGTITGELVGVTIKGDLIEGNTVVADKLVVRGEDGLYYKLNMQGIGSNVTTNYVKTDVVVDPGTDGIILEGTLTSTLDPVYEYVDEEGNTAYYTVVDNICYAVELSTSAIEIEQTDYNSLNGSVITARSITAEKVSVDDLVAFGATIGGFNITAHSLYSGVKESIDNSSEGVYMDTDAQFAIGNQNNYLKFYKDENDNYRLDISAASVMLANSSKNIESAFSDLEQQLVDTQDNLSGELETQKTDYEAFLAKFSKYIRFMEDENGNPTDTAMTIGSGDSAITLEIDNEKGLVFKKNGVQFGWWDGIDFHTGNIVVEVNERAQFGNFAFVPRSDGSLSFLKVGG